jgi:hypothetical protein
MTKPAQKHKYDRVTKTKNKPNAGTKAPYYESIDQQFIIIIIITTATFEIISVSCSTFTLV